MVQTSCCAHATKYNKGASSAKVKLFLDEKSAGFFLIRYCLLDSLEPTELSCTVVLCSMGIATGLASPAMAAWPDNFLQRVGFHNVLL